MKVFLDNSIESVSQTLQVAVKRQAVRWGDAVHTVEVHGHRRRPLPGDDQVWKREELECLPTIGRLAREGRISLYTYFELQSEGWKRSGSFPASDVGNVFAGVEFGHADAAIERSYFFQMEIGEYIRNEQVIRFCKWLLSPGIETLPEKLSGNPRFPEQLLEWFSQIQRFRDLCDGLVEKQYPDAFHLWTAEVNEATCFLTIDRKLIHVMTETKKIDLPCQPMAPSQLLDMLEVSERDPFEYEEDQFYDILGRRLR